MIATDVDGVYTGWGTAEQARLGAVTIDQVVEMKLPAGSMGPKGRRGLPVRREHRQRGGHRITGRHRQDRGRLGWDAGSVNVSAVDVGIRSRAANYCWQFSVW